MEEPTHNHTYQVKDWNAYFEGAKSRTYNNKTSCQMPTKHGLGYKTLVRRKNGVALFGAWCAMIQVLSRHPKERNGWVTDNGKKNGKPYTPHDLATLTDLPENVFFDMLQVCASYEVNWLTDTTGNYSSLLRIPQETIVPLHSDSDSDSDSDSKKGEDNPILNQKEQAEFDRFWQVYPKKEAKKAVIKAWKSAKDKPDIETIIKAVEAQKATNKWQKEGGQYIPMPLTGVNQGRWADEIGKQSSQSAKNRYVSNE